MHTIMLPILDSDTDTQTTYPYPADDLYSVCSWDSDCSMEDRFSYGATGVYEDYLSPSTPFVRMKDNQ